MPNKTFLKLPPSRQDEILRVARAEFAARDYESASLTRIMDSLGVTRGGFYRYFEGKRQLYEHLLQSCLAEKRAFIAGRLDSGGGGFFEVLRSGMDCHVAFNFECPQAAAFLLAAHRNGDLALEDFLFLADARLTMAEGIRDCQASGSLDPLLDPELVLLAISQLLMGLGPYIVRRCGLDLDSVVSRAAMEGPAVQAVFDQAIRLLRQGLEGRRSPPAP